ncbi:antibiotic biosynthesis monooxygenase family protein [Rhizobium sp. EC-SD404]|uniref:antibiotic biosynthesis monooxygenase family protein n=1 Tax=Rhizobium sp. EC-SD404 TaxID=2038389 RepID=UPI00125609D8|nr:antibiotic biosynthesis monooxygenase family protein [Rhizobium sp. EC-SD404]VVT24882.1 Antibiotic biosynthesis monooxygenase (modular protein) [Rhizobium sp. EC-SD404]
MTTYNDLSRNQMTDGPVRGEITGDCQKVNHDASESARRRFLKFASLGSMGAYSLLGARTASAQVNGGAEQNAEMAIVAGGNFLVINMFRPQAADQDKLVEFLKKGIGEEMAAQPGFLSAAIHKSTDSAHVLVYAYWTDEAALKAAGSVVQAGEAPNMLRAFELGAPEYHPYIVTDVIGPKR